jgi:general secretion pathway protein J
MSRQRNDRGARAGFTLIEVLAALAVLGMILVALSTGLRFGRQALLAQNRSMATENQVGPVDAALRSLVAKAWPGAVGAEARFAGTARALSFRTSMPESLTAQRIRDADVTIGVDSEHRLYLAWLPWYRNWMIAKPPPARIDLLANVDHVEFAYWDPSLHLPPGGWVTAWVGTTVPKLLRIRLVFTKDAGLRWPDIIVATARDPWTY